MYFFVYGTLKRGYGNNRLLQRESVKFIEEVVTNDLFYMNNVGYPYLFPKNIFNFDFKLHFARAKGELYHTDDTYVINDLDRLEGNGHHYHRNTISIKGHEDKIVEAYFQLNKKSITYGPPCRLDENGFYYWSR